MLDNQNLMHTLLEFFLNPAISSLPRVYPSPQLSEKNLSDIEILSIETSLMVLILQQFWKDVVVFWTMIRSERGFSMKQPDCSPEASIELWGWFISFQKHPRRRYTVPVNNFARPTNHCFDSAQISKCSAVTILLVMFRQESSLGVGLLDPGSSSFATGQGPVFLETSHNKRPITVHIYGVA